MPPMTGPVGRGRARRAALAIASALLATTALATAAAAQSQQPAHTVAATSQHPVPLRHELARPAVPAIPHHPVRRVCAQARPGYAACMAQVRTDVRGHLGKMAAGTDPAGYGPASLQSAYALPSATAGSGQTVAITDAYDDPNAESDLAVYRAQYGLPACTTANGCFRKVAQDGSTNYPAGDQGWSEEISLDVDMVSAICPSCHILLVEANGPTTDDLGVAINEAVSLGAKYVSNSWSGNEDPAEASWDTSYLDHPGVAITASTGDLGYGTGWPAVSPDVTAVGGTSLVADSSAPRGWAESAWSGAGSGCSSVEAKPSWQVDTGCSNKTAADVSAVANPATGVAVYDSYQYAGWAAFGGTSVASPIIASTYALAGTPQPGTNPARYPYDAFLSGTGLNDVVSGANGSCSPAYLCTGEPGYDGPTGLGTPNGTAAFTYHGDGTVSGTVTDSSTGQPVAGAQVSAAPYPSTTATASADGTFQLSLPAGTWTLTISDYGYDTQTLNVTVTDGGTITQDVHLAGIAHQDVSGTVTAADGQPWPLYAKVTWSDGSGHGGSTFTTPATGKYSLSLLGNASYTLQVTPLYPGYQAATKQVSVGTGPVTQDIGLGVDTLACTAIGYKATLKGNTEPFTGTSAPKGWKVTSTDLHYPGYANSPGWVFNDPAARPNTTGGSKNFAIVDSDYDGRHHYQDTTLAAPAVDLTGDTSPVIQFATDLQPSVNSEATVQLSVDGGRTWTTAWDSTAFPGAPGPRTVVVPVPAAAGKTGVQVRFGYQGQWSQYWELDDVFIGNRTCDRTDGSLLTGRVTDAATGQALNGATISNGTDKAVTVETPGDDAVGGGLYWLFTAATGQQQFTATMNGYPAQTATVSLTQGQVTQHDFALTTSP